MLKHLLLLLLFLYSQAYANIEESQQGGNNKVIEAESFSLTFDLENATKQDLKLLALLQDQAIFKKMSDFAATNLKLKSDILYTFHQGVKPFFGANQNEIFISYAFLYQTYDYLRHKFSQQGALSDKLFAFVIEKLLWVELGRTLINQYELPIIGEENISLDQFSTLMLINLNDQDSEYLLDASETFLLLDDTSTLLSRLSFQSETELDERRYLLVLCLVLGKDYEKHTALLDELSWDQSRLLQCQQHYREQMNAWYEALQPFLKYDNKFKSWLNLMRDVDVPTGVLIESGH